MKREFDWVVVLTVTILAAVSLALIYSVFQPLAGQEGVEPDYFYLKRQAMWVGLGLIASIVGYGVPFRVYESLAHTIYVICIILLIVVLFIPSRGETQRWIMIGPIGLQPSEFTKIAVMFVAARLMSGSRRDPNRWRNLVVLLAVLGVPFLLVLRQPDLGTALVFVGVLLPMLYWRGFKGLHILFILSPIVSSVLIIYGKYGPHNAWLFGVWPFGVFIVLIFVVAYMRRSFLLESATLVAANLGVGLVQPILWDNLKPYQQKRITNFLDPGADKLGAGWQVIQSKIAIGSGGFSGKGYLLGTQKALEFLPAKHTDFIFSALGEELGFMGAAGVLIVFSILVYKALSIAQKAKSEFASTVCIGIAAYFFFQVFVNIAMTTGMAPVTGIPLPFISYGGSSMLVSCFLVGFLLNVSARWAEY